MLEIGCKEFDIDRLAGIFAEGRVEFRCAGGRPGGAAHLVARLKQLENDVPGDEARCARDENFGHAKPPLFS